MDDGRGEKEDAEVMKRRAVIKDAMDKVDWQIVEDVYKDTARRCKIKYDNLLRYGFTEAQALDLCWRIS